MSLCFFHPLPHSPEIFIALNSFPLSSPPTLLNRLLVTFLVGLIGYDKGNTRLWHDITLQDPSGLDDKQAVILWIDM